MATFTSVTSGNWNDGATWGKTSPGVKGTDWPGNAGDVVNIGTTAGQAHVVTYNVSETNALGQITIGATSGAGVSRLEFATNLNTKLTLGHQDILINATGELRVGSSGAIVPKQYTAELVWNTTADNTKGINLVAGGKFTVYGDPDYFGSDYDTILATSSGAIPAAGNSVTIAVIGDFTTKWIAGQELVVHKGGAYASYVNDFCRLAIIRVSANGANTDVACTVTERPAALTCLVGADVLNVSRNVLFYKLGYNANLGQNNTLRPRVANANAALTTNININNCSFGGFYNSFAGHANTGIGIVCRNGLYCLLTVYDSNITFLCFSHNLGISTVYSSTIQGVILNCTGGINAAGNSNIYTDIYGCSIYGISTSQYSTIFGNIYSCGYGTGGLQEIFIVGSIGYDSLGVAKANATDFNNTSYGNYPSKIKVLNSKVPTTPVFGGRNAMPYRGRVNFEHYQQVAQAHYIADSWGDIYKVAADGSGDNPSQRSGGGADVQEVTPQSNCAASSYLEIFNVRLWAIAGVSKAYRFYVQTDFAALLTAALKLYGDYLDQVSGGHLATVSSTQNIATRANASDWSQYVEVTINPAQDGYVNLYLWLMGYESDKKVWVDPKPEGVAMTPRWSYGEVVLEPITASGGGTVSPTNLGLVPLGIKQVAI